MLDGEKCMRSAHSRTSRGLQSTHIAKPISLNVHGGQAKRIERESPSRIMSATLTATRIGVLAMLQQHKEREHLLTRVLISPGRRAH